MIYDQDSPAADFEREQSRERRQQAEMRADEWPALPVLEPVTVRPVRLTAPEFTRKRFGMCPECPELDVIDLSRHVCPAKE